MKRYIGNHVFVSESLFTFYRFEIDEESRENVQCVVDVVIVFVRLFLFCWPGHNVK